MNVYIEQPGAKRCPGPTPQPVDFWELLQKVSLVVGLVVAVRSLTR
jgi:hypothetical protein